MRASPLGALVLRVRVFLVAGGAWSSLCGIHGVAAKGRRIRLGAATTGVFEEVAAEAPRAEATRT